MSDDAPQVEYLGPEEPGSRRHGGRRGLAAAAAVGVLVVGGAGAWGVTQFLSGGEAAATAVPADALAYVSLDLDPSGAQKLEALRTMRKFPALKDKLGVNAGDDLRRWLYQGLSSDGPCKDLDFDTDIDPWLGDRIAVSVVPGDDQPVPFGVVQVKDQGKAEKGLAAIAECGDEKQPGVAFTGDYMVVAETDAIAEGVVADAEKSSLADDDDFQRWVDEAGGAGIVTGYVSADAPAAFLDEMDPAPGDDNPMGYAAGAGAEELQAIFKDFEGAALVVRFDDASLELETAAAGMGSVVEQGDGDSGLGDLPATTAVALGLAVSDHAVSDLLDAMATSTGQDELDSRVHEFESTTGLSLPEDLQTLLGDGFSLALDRSVDLGSLFSGGDLSSIPLGVRIVGDPNEIKPVLDKVLTATGTEGVLSVEPGDGVLAVGLDPEQVAQLAEDNDLGGEESFTKALPGFDGKDGGVYVDFDSGDWLTELLAADPAADEARANIEPLASLGVTGHTEDGVVHGVLRLTTD